MHISNDIELTPTHKVIPVRENWGKAVMMTLLSEQESNHVGALRALEEEFHTRTRLNHHCVYATVYDSETLERVAEASYPLRGLLKMDTIVKITPIWANYWELYARVLVPALTNQIRAKHESAKAYSKTRSGVSRAATARKIPLRSFHSHGDPRACVEALRKSVNSIEYATGTQIEWEWLAVHDVVPTNASVIEISKDAANWTTGIDGTTNYSTGNARAWKNRIAAVLRVVDLMVIDNNNPEDTPSVVTFVLAGLAIGGTALLRMPAITTMGVAAVIHLFEQCFERSSIIHIWSTDRVYLVGVGYLGGVQSGHIKRLIEFCESYRSAGNVSPFRLEYMQSAGYISTIEKLSRVNDRVYRWRQDHYDQLLHTYSKITKSTSAGTFDSYIDVILDDTYPDESQRWVSATKFNLFQIDTA